MALQDSLLLNSPFNTPIAQRFAANFDAGSSPPLSSPLHRFRTSQSHSHSQLKPSSSPAIPHPPSPFIIKNLALDTPKQSTHRMSPSASINDLPAELLQDIHLRCTNHNLPLVSRHLYNSLNHPSPTYAARWLLKLYEAYGYRTLLARAFKHRVMDLDVLKEMVRIWDERRGHRPSRGSRQRVEATNDPSTPVRPRHIRPPLQLPEVPRRAVRLSPQGVSPLLVYIFDHFEASVDSFNGFPLQRAALDKNHELAEWLLRRGADPGLRDSLAIEAAIDRKDLKMIKLLIEPFEDASPRGKRRRVSDRVSIGSNLVEKALASGTDEIVDYLVHEKGAMPPLGYIMGLSQ